MKSIIFAALIFLTGFQPAEAIEVGRVANDGGGAIVFTSETCKVDPRKYLFFAYIASCQAGSGCWVIVGKEIFAKWSDDSIRIYPLDAITISEEFQRAYAEYANRKEM